ncbi:MAG: type III pantothenate kinase [Candidatus Acetothermia bacterium]|nr:type III pantothenate kinase [Candidatus Acetothermia bacterium]MDH7504816.1 type III pantothenate kinase [Candidatus Acetothermia bacterium]
MRLLAIDVGNTNISAGLFSDSGELEEAWKVPNSSEFWAEAARRLGRRFNGIEAVGLSSVVKGLAEQLKSGLSEFFASCGLGRPPQVRVLTKDTRWPLPSAYKPGLGTDRMLAAIAASRLYGRPVIVVDIGSAVTVDFVDKEGVFRGGLILAGAGMRLRALAQFTSALPEIPIPDPEEPPPLIGTDTVSCMSAGVHHGLRQEIQGLVRAIQAQAAQEGAPEAAVALTGGGSRLFAKDCPEGWRLDPWLVLKGIYFVVVEEGSKDR